MRSIIVLITFSAACLILCWEAGRKESASKVGAEGQIGETSLDWPSITDIKVKTLFGSNNGCRHSPGVGVLLRVCAPRDSPLPTILTAKSLDYQSSRCKRQRTISSAKPRRGNPLRPSCWRRRQRKLGPNLSFHF